MSKPPTKKVEVRFGRASVNPAIAAELLALTPNLRGRVVGVILAAHASGVDLKKLAEASSRLSELAITLNQSNYRPHEVDEAIDIIKSLKI